MITKGNVVLSWLITVLTPLALIGMSLRILLTPCFLQIEYSLPYFPQDEFGFTKADRLRWAPLALNYLENQSDISYLGDLKFDDGQPLYNPRELSHMQDVKAVVKRALNAWYITILFMLGSGLWAISAGWTKLYLSALSRGGWLMVGIALTIGAIVSVGITLSPAVFWEFFSGFHKLFFEGDSWLFLFSDTLIRLFPIRFWQDAFLFSSLLALGGGIALGLGLRSR